MVSSIFNASANVAEVREQSSFQNIEDGGGLSIAVENLRPIVRQLTRPATPAPAACQRVDPG